jgi:hypothetical protein
MIAAVDGRRVTVGEASGSVEVHERSPDGSLVPYPHLGTFWFAWSGYHPATTAVPADAAGDCGGRRR